MISWKQKKSISNRTGELLCVNAAKKSTRVFFRFGNMK